MEDVCSGCGDPNIYLCSKCGKHYQDHTKEKHCIQYAKCKCHKRKWRECEPVEAIAWAQVRTIEAPFKGQTSKELYKYGVRFSDDSVVACESQYEGDLSDVTPGEGIQPPTWWIGAFRQ